MLTHLLVFSSISYTAQAHLPKTGAAHHGLGPLISVINEDNFWEIPLEISPSQVTLGCINLGRGGRVEKIDFNPSNRKSIQKRTVFTSSLFCGSKCYRDWSEKGSVLIWLNKPNHIPQSISQLDT